MILVSQKMNLMNLMNLKATQIQSYQKMKNSKNEKFKKVFAQNFLICYNPSLENKKSRCKSSEVRVILRSMTTSITRFLFCRHCLRNKSTPCRHLHEKGEHYDRK